MILPVQYFTTTNSTPCIQNAQVMLLSRNPFQSEFVASATSRSNSYELSTP